MGTIFAFQQSDRCIPLKQQYNLIMIDNRGAYSALIHINGEEAIRSLIQELAFIDKENAITIISRLQVSLWSTLSVWLTISAPPSLAN
jgi:hypothetical protein